MHLPASSATIVYIGETGSELSPATAKIFEGSAAAFPPKTLNLESYQLFAEDTINAVNQQRRIHPLVEHYIIRILPLNIVPNWAAFSLRINEQTKIHNTQITQEYVLPVTINEHNRSWSFQTDVPELTIADFPAFIKKMNELFITGIQEHFDVQPWVLSKDRNLDEFLDQIWSSATPYDFLHPLPFIDRIQHHIAQRPFEILDDHPVNAHLKSHDLTLHIEHAIATPDMEAPCEFTVHLLTKQDDYVSETAGTMPTVRYGVDGEKAYVYAVQIPRVHHLTQKDVDRADEEFAELGEKQKQYFDDIRNNHPDEFRQIFGNVPDSIFMQTDPKQFVLDFLAYLKHTFPKLYQGQEPNYKNWMKKRVKQNLPDAIEIFFSSEMTDLQTNAENILSVPQFRQIPELRKKIMRTLYEIDSGIPKDAAFNEWKNAVEKQKIDPSVQVPEYPEDNILDVPRPAVVSLAAACELFRKAGMKKLIVPIYLPLRWEHHAWVKGNAESAENLQHITTEALVRLFQRIETQINGLEIAQYPDDDGFMRLRFTDPTKPLTSDNQLLGEVLSAVTSTKLQFGKNIKR